AGAARRRTHGQLRPATRLPRLARCRSPAGLWHRSRPRIRRRPGLRRCRGGSGAIRSRAPNGGARMSAARTCWGIYRETAHSPGRIDDDRAILESVAAAMTARGFTVELVGPDGPFDTEFANIFVMCERGPVLDRLKDAEKTGSIVVNSPDAIRNTY